MSTTHILDFVCDSYTGNFELEFFSYVFGQADSDSDRRDFTKYVSEEDSARFEELYEDFFTGWNGEYGWTRVEIARVPFDGAPDTVNSVRIRVSDEMWQAVMTPELIKEWKTRAADFFKVYRKNASTYSNPDGAFLGLVHSTSTVVVTPGETL